MVDFSEDHLWGHGFDTSVCEGCPHKESSMLGPQKCGLCGCPLFNLNATNAPPESCPRLAQHKQE